MKTALRTRAALLTAVAGLTLSMAACGGDDTDTDTDAGGTTTAAEQTTAEETTTEAEETSEEAEPAGENFGAGCADVPTDPSDPGSFEGMSTAPVATAASANPVLSTLVTAVQTAGLVETLDTLPEATVFAPANSAFEAVPTADLDALLADQAQLTSVLTYHVIPQRLSPEELAGTFTTAQGAELTIEGSGEDFTVGTADTTVLGTPAAVVCGNVQTANATVYIIDAVLAPPAA